MLRTSYLILALVCALSARADSLFGDRVLAKGKNVEIKASEVEDMFIAYKAQRAAAGQPVPEREEDIKKVESEIVDTLISSKLMLAHATPADRTNGLAQAAKFIEDRKTNAPSEAAFKRTLIANGLSYDKFVKQVEEQGIIKAVVDRELRPKITVTDEQVEKFYKDNTKLFEEPEKWKVAHIFLANRDRNTRIEIPEAEKSLKKAKIEEALAKVRAPGADFTKIIKEYSEHASKDTGGETTFSPGQMPPEFQAATASMKPGQVSDIIISGLGWHIIKLLEYTPAKTAGFASVKDKIKEAMMTDAVQKAIPEYVAGLRKEAGVEMVAEGK